MTDRVASPLAGPFLFPDPIGQAPIHSGYQTALPRSGRSQEIGKTHLPGYRARRLRAALCVLARRASWHVKQPLAQCQTLGREALDRGSPASDALCRLVGQKAPGSLLTLKVTHAQSLASQQAQTDPKTAHGRGPGQSVQRLLGSVAWLARASLPDVLPHQSQLRDKICRTCVASTSASPKQDFRISAVALPDFCRIALR